MIAPQTFIRRFRNVNVIKMIDGWKRIDKYPFEGGCSDFALTVLLLTEGSWFKVFLAVLNPFYVSFWLAQSPSNKWYWPRHVILYHKDYGWIDSRNPEWRASPAPHKLRLPLPFFWVWIRIVWGWIWMLGVYLVDLVRK